MTGAAGLGDGTKLLPSYGDTLVIDLKSHSYSRQLGLSHPASVSEAL